MDEGHGSFPQKNEGMLTRKWANAFLWRESKNQKTDTLISIFFFWEFRKKSKKIHYSTQCPNIQKYILLVIECISFKETYIFFHIVKSILFLTNGLILYKVIIKIYMFLNDVLFLYLTLFCESFCKYQHSLRAKFLSENLILKLIQLSRQSSCM